MLAPVLTAMALSYNRLSFPCTSDDLLTAFDAVERDVSALIASADRPTLCRRPADGWSPTQVLEHLGSIVRVYVDGMEKGRARAPRATDGEAAAIRPGCVSRWFIRQMEPPIRRRFRAPRAITPGPDPRFEDAWTAFLGGNDVFRDFARRCRAIDPNRARFPNPLARGVRFTIGTGLALMVAHHRRHACQLERLLRAGAEA